jgi:hypothetical protein
MSATEPELFEGIEAATRFHVEPGRTSRD